MKTIYNLDLKTNDLIAEAEENYKFQPVLTSKLDNHRGDFTETTLLEIVLWKTNRYPSISAELINDINSLRESFSIGKAKHLLRNLLSLKGFDLPMASTVLRFACPDEFQIIDQRVYRFINEDGDVFKKPYSDDKKVEVYFDYLDKLKVVCKKYDIPFQKANRILYQLDKTVNADCPIKY